MLRYVRTLLFSHSTYCYTFESALELFDHIIKSIKDIPFSLRDSVYGTLAMSRFYQRNGTGSGPQSRRDLLQALQTVTASAMYIDNNELINKKLFKVVLPHSSRQSRGPFISGCFERRVLFDRDESRVISKSYADETREARLHIDLKHTKRRRKGGNEDVRCVKALSPQALAMRQPSAHHSAARQQACIVRGVLQVPESNGMRRLYNISLDKRCN